VGLHLPDIDLLSSWHCRLLLAAVSADIIIIYDIGMANSYFFVLSDNNQKNMK
jgi:hypothetical protein